MEYLLTISIGPVQDFIAAARKTRDLWMGSKMLCDVTRAAALAVQDIGGDLVFPAPSCLSSDNSDKPIANKIVAVIKSGDPKQVSEKAREAALECLRGYKSKLLEKFKSDAPSVSSAIDNTLLDSQIENFLEYYAAWWQMEDYAKARSNVERLMAGRKALRDFKPPDGRAGVPKSSLDPSRESVFDPKEDLPKLGIKKGEPLDGVSLIKRVAEIRRFVSVSRVAADPFIRRLKSDCPDILRQLRDAAEALKDTDLVQRFDCTGMSQYKDFPYDTQLLFGDASESERKNLSEDQQKLDKVDEFCRLVDEARETLKVGEVIPYFAVIAADGDHMGALISSTVNPGDHRKLSADLAEFSAEAEKIVAKHQGALVYSGGDDVLAFLPLDKALACADELRNKFTDMLKGFAKGNVKPSLSVGVSIAHYGSHLQDLLEWARRAEREAKGNGRNSLAVHLHTRTAGDEYIGSVHSWDDNPVSNRWTVLVRALENEDVSTGFAYELRRLCMELKELKDVVEDKKYQDPDNPSLVKNLLEKEVERIAERKRGERGNVRARTEEVLKLPHSTIKDVETLASEMIISRHLVRANKIAAGTQQEVAQVEQ